ncbi:S8 family serine peptidase [Candidatus Poribacteria bacterium]
MVTQVRLSFACVLLAVLALAFQATAQDLIRNYTPPVWQAEDVKWSRDVAPHNKIDDLIDSSTETTFDVVVNFERCVTDAHIQMLENLSQTSTVQKKLKYISSVTVGGVTKADLQTIVASEAVAFVEGQWEFELALDVSLPNICVTAGSPDCAGNVDSLGFDGTGVNIVIMDTGVDNTIHQAFSATPFIAGYDATTQTMVDPDDEHGHGTHVASIALGRATANVPRGVAPGAGLIDVRVSDQTGGIQWNWVEDALQVVYDNRIVWGVDIINMSLGQRNPQGQRAGTDGTDAFSQLVDLAQSMGIVIVAAAGNHGPNNNDLPTPAAATRAIAVAAFNDVNTPNWGDDVIWNDSASGPREDDNDLDRMDELKPEVAAPGVDILAARFDTTDLPSRRSGTSMATPHVAGVAALIIEANPTINAGAVKALIISTADARGTPSLPAIDPVWNDRFGWGRVNAFAAVDTATVADLTFPSHPASPSWLSPDIQTNPFPPRVGQQTTVSVDIENRGPSAANGVRIHFGVHVFSASTPTFQDIATEIVDLPVGITNVSTQWIPAHSDHQCMKVEIAYGDDTDFANNEAQRNLTVTQSPVKFQVKNTFTEEAAEIKLVPTFQNPQAEWDVEIKPSAVTLAAEDCPADIEVIMTPPADASPGDTQTVHIAAMIDIEGEVIPLGGVSIRDTKKDREPPELIMPVWVWGVIIIVLLLLVSVMIRQRRRARS